ncbi:MAG: T9SS type A sorting domain-containing protein [candidate division KSB1 bacterium]|nr:T9SS type A sorting domain-containing protein [candidate division KSB1 bacterium]
MYDLAAGPQYTDLNVMPDQTYTYSVTAVDGHENESRYSETVISGVTRVLDSPARPVAYQLKANFPNPFNLYTRIEYDLPESAEVCISIYDINGKFVSHLIQTRQNAGSYKIIWQPENLSSGTYLIRMQADGFTSVHKCLFLK